jgi:tetratricopeptide (TPR) repeat protein
LLSAGDETPRTAPLQDGTWNQRPAGAGDYQIVMEISGRGQIAAFRPPPSDIRSLEAICEARREGFAIALPTAEQEVASLVARPPKGGGLLDLAWAHQDLGQLWAYQGRMDKAIAEFEAAQAIAAGNADPAFTGASAFLEAGLGILEMRRGELENCVHDQNAARCLFPIEGPGQHERPSGSERAVAHFLRYLQKKPEDLEVRWLLNVAEMTLGRYPQGVPKEYLIPSTGFASGDDPGRFPDVASRLGLDAPGLAGGVVVDDVDGDGRLDVVLSSIDACAPLRYYHQEPDGTFRDRTVAAGLANQLGGINLVQTDFDNDGRLDLFVMRGGWEQPMRNSLLHQNPDGTFTDVTLASGLAKVVRRTHSAAWADFDGDGWLDLFVGHEESPSALFKNRGDGTFVDVSHAAGVDRIAFTKGATWGDYDNDGRPDLYVSNFGGENFLYHNEGDGTFKEVGKAKGVEKPIMSFATWFFDYDNDGWQDLFVASFMPSVTEVARYYLGLPRQAETMRLYHNDGHGGFEDVTKAVGLDRVVPTMGANFGDLDNDGFLDFYLGTGAPSYAALMPNVMFKNREGRSFVDVTTATGTGHLQKGHGVAFADIEGSGNQDIFANIGGFIAGDAYHKVLFHNPGHGNDWLGVHLVGVRSNRAAIGARIRVDVLGADGKKRSIHRTVNSGGSFGASPLAQEIGLGRGARIETLEVFWPTSNTRQVFHDVPVNQAIEVREGEPAIRKAGAVRAAQ